MDSTAPVEAVFEKRKPDRVPIHHLGFSAEVASALLGRQAYVGGGIQQWREATALWQGEQAHQEFLERSFQDAIDIALLCEHDIVRANYWRSRRKPTKRLDENTFLYEYGSEDEWKVLRCDPPSEQCNMYPYRQREALTFEDLEAQLDALEEEIADYQHCEEDFAFEIRAQRLLGHEKPIRVSAVSAGIPLHAVWLEATMLRPDLVLRLLDLQVERATRNVDFLVQFGFRYFFGGGDFASNKGPMYSLRVFKDFLLPRLQRISEMCHERGVYHLFASDGDLWPVAEYLFGQSGIDCYFEIDRRAGMDLATLREHFPDLALIGNISSHTVAAGTKGEVVAETLACLGEAHRSGGIVVGVSNYLVPGTPIENVTAMLETIAEHR